MPLGSFCVSRAQEGRPTRSLEKAGQWLHSQLQTLSQEQKAIGPSREGDLPKTACLSRMPRGGWAQSLEQGPQPRTVAVPHVRCNDEGRLTVSHTEVHGDALSVHSGPFLGFYGIRGHPQRTQRIHGTTQKMITG